MPIRCYTCGCFIKKIKILKGLKEGKIYNVQDLKNINLRLCCLKHLPKKSINASIAKK